MQIFCVLYHLGFEITVKNDEFLSLYPKKIPITLVVRGIF